MAQVERWQNTQAPHQHHGGEGKITEVRFSSSNQILPRTSWQGLNKIKGPCEEEKT